MSLKLGCEIQPRRKDKVKGGLILSIATSLPALPTLCSASGGLQANSADTAWMLVATALVMLMTPALALFYGGMVRQKNVLNTIMLSLSALCIVSIQWVLFGYTISFGPDIGSAIGGLDFLGLEGVGFSPREGQSIPHQLFMMFQGMFAILTPALVTGAIVERMKFSSFLIFLVAWSTLVYDLLAHWVWGGGWLSQLGALDFAGGTVVHISSGVSGLAACLILGPRKDMAYEPVHPNNLPLTIAAGGLLWFGWFGFNAGSALAATPVASHALVVTHTASAMGATAWMFTEWLHRGKPTALGTITGALAGLVAITPAAGYVQVISSLLVGLVAGVVCYWAVVKMKAKFRYDDSLDVFGVHGVAGTWGAIATGIFATSAIPGSADGLISGNMRQVLVQILATSVSWIVSLGFTAGILLAIKALFGLRVCQEDEISGLDIALHGEKAYSLGFLEGRWGAPTATQGSLSKVQASYAPASSQGEWENS